MFSGPICGGRRADPGIAVGCMGAWGIPGWLWKALLPWVPFEGRGMGAALG